MKLPVAFHVFGFQHRRLLQWFSSSMQMQKIWACHSQCFGMFAINSRSMFWQWSIQGMASYTTWSRRKLQSMKLLSQHFDSLLMKLVWEPWWNEQLFQNKLKINSSMYCSKEGSKVAQGDESNDSLSISYWAVVIDFSAALSLYFGQQIKWKKTCW